MRLRHNSQGQIIPVAAFVVGLEGVVANRNSRAIRQVGEGPGDGRSGGIRNYSEDCSRREHGIAAVVEENLRPLNGNSFGLGLVGRVRTTVERALVSGIGHES